LYHEFPVKNDENHFNLNTLYNDIKVENLLDGMMVKIHVVEKQKSSVSLNKLRFHVRM